MEWEDKQMSSDDVSATDRAMGSKETKQTTLKLIVSFNYTRLSGGYTEEQRKEEATKLLSCRR
jgi:hypothetical protein